MSHVIHLQSSSARRQGPAKAQRNQTTSWLFDMGAAITWMNSKSFNTAFGQQKLMAQGCTASSGDALNYLGVYEVELWIKGKMFTYPGNVIK